MSEAKKGITRRRFIKGAAALATAGAVFPQIVPRHVVGGKGHTPPSETLYVAGIGAGVWGHINLQAADQCGARIVALCDVDSENAILSYDYFSDATQYTDYRELLEKEKGTIEIKRKMERVRGVEPLTSSLGNRRYCNSMKHHGTLNAAE